MAHKWISCSINVPVFVFFMITTFVVITTVGAALHNRHDPTPSISNHHKYSGLLHGIGAYKRKLQEQGLINSIDDQLYESNSASDEESISNDYSTDFNELEMLQLIPIIIGELQFRRIASSDEVMLRNVFGSLWPMMVEEADRRRERRRAARSMTNTDSTAAHPTAPVHPHRHHHQQQPQQRWPPIDPVLKSILRAQRDHDYAELSREQAFARSQNNLLSGAVGANEHSMAAKLAKLWTEQNGNVEPSQRILKLAAVLIHEQMVRRQKRAQRKSLRRRANAVAAARDAAAAVRAAPATPSATPAVENTSVFQVRRTGAAAVRSKRSTATATATAGGALVMDSNDVEIFDEDYSYDEMLPDDEALMFEDVGENYRQIVNADVDADQDVADEESAALDPTLVALRSDDVQLLRQMYGVAEPQDRSAGSVTELFKLADRHRELKRRNERNLFNRWRSFGN